MFDKPYKIKGKHATYAKFLSATTERLNRDAKVAGVFRYIVDIYLVAPLIGVAYNLKSDEDTKTDDDVTIFAEAIINQQENLTHVFRLVMLAESNSKLNDDEKIQRAFKDDENSLKVLENMELFHQYMRGGIEWLFKQFTEDATTREDYLAKMTEIVDTYKQDFYFEI
ncbi:MAG: hypothetical protein KMY55_01505 [Dethiosulfatibacter sp.]|nr:hypothetical protein [Dethiosulfatibacter sp.]